MYLCSIKDRLHSNLIVGYSAGWLPVCDGCPLDAAAHPPRHFLWVQTSPRLYDFQSLLPYEKTDSASTKAFT